MTDQDWFDKQAQIGNSIAAKLNVVRKGTAISKAIDQLALRIVSAGDSLRLLHDKSPHNFLFDGTMVLRGIYDASLQSLYILNDAAFQEERANLYLDFYWVEKMKFIRRFDRSQTQLGRHVSQSTLRANAEPEIQREFQRVQAKFLDSKGKLRNHWYPNNLQFLAEKTGFESECEIFQQFLSGAVHASSFAMQHPPFQGKPELMLEFAWKFSFRVLGKYAEYAQVTLDVIETEIVKSASKPLVDF